MDKFVHYDKKNDCILELLVPHGKIMEPAAQDYKTWHWSLKFFIASRQTTEIWTISCETLVASSWRNKIVILGNPPGNASKMPFFVPVLGTFIIYISRYFTIQTQNLNTL